MKIKTEAADDVLRKASGGTDYGPQIIEILKGIPKGHTVEDSAMSEELGVGRDKWYRYLKTHLNGIPYTHRCYVSGHPRWAMPETIDYMCSKGAKRKGGAK